MAKQGLSYYGVDTDRYANRKIKRLKHSFGCSGIAVYDYLLCEVYRDRGCVLAWDDDTAFDVADYFGLKVNTVKEIVKYCGSVGLFDAELLSRGTITSEAIQRRYLEMSQRARRVNITIPEDCRLLPTFSAKLTEETAKMQEDLRKVNKSKVNNNKSLCNAHACASATDEERERFLEIFTFVKNFHNPQQEVERFVSHYDASGWCRKDSTVPVKNKEALAQMWKPQQEGQRFPEDVRQWLHRAYRNAQESSAKEAQNILTQVYRATMEDGTARIDCTKEAALALERNFAYRPTWRVTYRIPN